MYRVLIADDEPLMRQALKVMISKVDGFEVLYSVGSEEQAVEICENNNIDIVFMDIMMHGKSGIECGKKIYAHNSNTIIVIVSLYDNFNFVIEALKSKVKAYISKPVSFEQIKTLLESYKLENEAKNSNRIEDKSHKIFSIIKGNDFKKIYYEVPKIVGSIYDSKITDVEFLKEDFMNIGQQLVNSIGISKEKIDELFPINNLLLKEKRYFEFWLFKVMNYVFQQNSIKKHDLLKTVFDYIEENIEESIGLNEIIHNCSVSQGYLSRIFKRQFNVSVMEYLHMRKINMAKSYFCFTDLSITDVAFKLGYNESSYFSKVFKKYENITVYSYKRIL